MTIGLTTVLFGEGTKLAVVGMKDCAFVLMKGLFSVLAETSDTLTPLSRSVKSS